MTTVIALLAAGITFVAVFAAVTVLLGVAFAAADLSAEDPGWFKRRARPFGSDIH